MLKLNIGAGNTVIDGFTPIDRALGSEAYPLPYADSTVDEIRASHILEHFDFKQAQDALSEWVRVLKPGGLFLFDTINRTMLAAFMIVHIGESVLRLLPRGTHDPAKFIKPSELSAKLVARGLSVGSLVGFGPCGLNRRLDFTFGRLPSVQVMYVGHACMPAAT